MPYGRPLPKPRRRKDNYGHLIIDGYTFMGNPRVPPMPNRLALKDRTTLEFKVLSHDVGATSLVLANIDPKWPDVQKFETHEGPYTGNFRLYLDNGTLLAEAAPDHSNQKVLTRRLFDKTVLEITVNPADGVVLYTQYNL